MSCPSIALLCCLCACTAPVAAQYLDTASGASTEPLRDASRSVRAQPLSNGVVTHQVQLPAQPGQAPVTVRTIQPDRVAGNYRIDFEALDTDHDGDISRSEAQAHPALADEFDALDTRHSGRLSRAQLAGWL